jgi:hypothetical protein
MFQAGPTGERAGRMSSVWVSRSRSAHPDGTRPATADENVRGI